MVDRVTAVGLAREAGVDPKAFRARLRRADLAWHHHREPWVADAGSDRHDDMVTVLQQMTEHA